MADKEKQQESSGATDPSKDENEKDANPVGLTSKTRPKNVSAPNASDEQTGEGTGAKAGEYS